MNIKFTMRDLMSVYRRLWSSTEKTVSLIEAKMLTNVFPAHLIDDDDPLDRQRLAVEYYDKDQTAQVIVFEKHPLKEEWTSVKQPNRIVLTSAELVQFAAEKAHTLPDHYNPPCVEVDDLWAVYHSNYPGLDSKMRPVSSHPEISAYPYLVNDRETKRPDEFLLLNTGGESILVRPETTCDFVNLSNGGTMTFEDILSYARS